MGAVKTSRRVKAEILTCGDETSIAKVERDEKAYNRANEDLRCMNDPLSYGETNNYLKMRGKPMKRRTKS